MALIIAGERSGVGKTTITLTLLAFLCKRYNKVQSFKVGPDYIDPMFHKYVTGRACRNLDPILTSETYVKQCFARHIQDVNYALVEGVMGLFDGVGRITPFSKKINEIGEEGYSGNKEEVFTKSPIFISFASTAHIAKLLNLPVVLVIDCSRLSGSVAAIVYGYCSFDPSIKIAGLILNRVGSDRHLSLLKNALEPLQIPIFGILRRQDNIAIPDRHLGLIPTSELPQMDTLIEKLVLLGETCFDWQRLLPLLEVGNGERVIGKGTGRREQGEGTREKGEQKTEDFVFDQLPITDYQLPHQPKARAFNNPPIKIAFERSKLNTTHAENAPRVAIAWDKAFNFYYQENIELLEEFGAELVFWSPLQDTELPKNIQGMYFGGGFPEVFASQLAANVDVLLSVKTAIFSGIPTIAECGGLMYLCEQIIDFAGQSWSMVGALPTTTVMDKRLSLGYRRAVALQDTILVSKGKVVCGHEFHRSHLRVSPEKSLWQTYRYDLEEFTGDEGWVFPANLHASYVHLHWGATPEIPQRFLECCFNSMFI
ncbi:cobyrinate a,c-diamide synthase [Mastigocoleus testarum]|uniref:Cobyrinate a,c-diamide synthase n=1 Tax=Mastigocoleus testarum BC008 TaxID=371196 RepID=A0A0V7ZT26_9CYAN|nr:cobyrinate a,c-diamide synthase [Mastigocoleus testarum]KST67611.1 cobyrinic acid a,c-diamide synthase [Mastigocoleus testarum BC008]KST69753.1 cobyrinic acid a,c-diamide synthase [Mastigocoleus testarum BC008]